MKYLLFGTGEYYNRYKKWFKKNDIVALLDNDNKKQNKMLDGIKIVSPNEGIKLSYDVIIILSFYVKEMKAQLCEIGVEPDKIYHFYDLNSLIYTSKIKKKVLYFGKSKEFLNRSSKQKILLLSHDLEFGGPALALFYLSNILQQNGYSVLVASMLDGVLRDKFLMEDIPVIVDANLQVETMSDVEWIKDFDMIFCNTINYHIFLTQRNLSIPVIWWLHDSLFFYGGVKKSNLEKISFENLKVCSVGPVPEKAIKIFLPDIVVEKLIYGSKDIVGKIRKVLKPKNDKLLFVVIGYIEARKGQDILIDAMDKLPKEITDRIMVYFIGNDTSMLAQTLKKRTDKDSNIVFRGCVGRNEIDEILAKTDMLLCPSREDPMPTVCAEAMMHSVPCLVSDKTGTAEYIDDGANGIVFESENIDELAQKITWCIENSDKLHDIGIKARNIYDENFSVDVFERNLMRLIDCI